jgi:DNA-binding GntR family transcriptional regulator
MPVKRMKKGALSDDASYERLRAAIAAGALLPNERLIESELAEHLGVGRATVRTALARLAQENIVERLPNRGARVRRISAKEAVEILEARIALEGIAARHAAANATDADVGELRKILDEMEQRTDHGIAASLIENLRSRSAQHPFRATLHPTEPAVRVRQHRAIADAIARRDPDAAERAMRDHLADVMLGLRAELRRTNPIAELGLAN